MNKIKIIYDAAKKMKGKESVKGTLKAEGLKDKERMFAINNSFEKSTQDGKLKGKTSIEADCDGNKIKLENSIDFQGDSFKGHQCGMKHIHVAHRHPHAVGVKAGLGKLTALLGILSSIRLEEKENGAAVLSLNSVDMPEDIRSTFHEHMKQCCKVQEQMEGNDPQHMCLKEFHSMDNVDFSLIVAINESSEVENILISISGVQQDEKDEKHEMILTAELSLLW